MHFGLCRFVHATYRIRCRSMNTNPQNRINKSIVCRCSHAIASLDAIARRLLIPDASEITRE